MENFMIDGWMRSRRMRRKIGSTDMQSYRRSLQTLHGTLIARRASLLLLLLVLLVALYCTRSLPPRIAVIRPTAPPRTDGCTHAASAAHATGLQRLSGRWLSSVRLLWLRGLSVGVWWEGAGASHGAARRDARCACAGGGGTIAIG